MSADGVLDCELAISWRTHNSPDPSDASVVGSGRDGIKMRLSEIERIAKAAMDACAEVINYPMDSFAREKLCNSLAELVDPAFFETDQSRRDSFNHLLQQANAGGTIADS
jgi:hypothetical protein